MNFPNNLTIRDFEFEKKLSDSHWEAQEQKQIDFSPYIFCEIFANVEVLQVYGEETKEYVFALYKGGRFIGTAYFGTLYSDKDLFIIKRDYIPENWDDIPEYMRTISGVWYHKFETNQYAWVYDKILNKVK